jgi:excisionase family DNA binding protein
MTMKRAPMPGVPKTQTARYSLLGQQLLQQQQQITALFQERLLTVREAALALGVTVGTVRRYTRTKQLRAVRVGRLGWMKIPLSAVRELLEKGATNG